MKKRNPKKQFRKAKPFLLFRILSLLFLAGAFLMLPQHNFYAIKSYSEAEYTPVVEKVLIPPSPHPIPINITNQEAPPVTAPGIVVMDIASGVVLLEKNPDVKMLPASTTKIMTALIALEKYSMDDVVTVKTVISERQVMGLVTGEKITVENLLYGILVHSANDAAFALAEHFEDGGVEGFISTMNQKATELHLTNTHFVNPIGFDHADQYTTPKDLARLSMYALENPIVNKFVGVAQITVSDTTFTYFHPLKNVNQLLGKIPGVSGVKTGWTQAAGECLVSTAQRNGEKILIVLLGSENRFGETEQLINWTFTNFKWQPVEIPQ